MSTNYEAIIGIGRYFPDLGDAAEWFLQNYLHPLSPLEAEYAKNHFQSFLDSLSAVQGDGTVYLPELVCLQAQSGEQFCLVYLLPEDDPKEFAAAVSRSHELWSQHFRLPASVQNHIRTS